jgi:CBS domain-containing protein
MAFNDEIHAILERKGAWVHSVPPDATVYEALELMSAKDIGALAVTSAGEILGVFSERDYARKIILSGKSSRETTVREIMSSPAITVEPDWTVDECMQLMTGKRIRHLPVVRGAAVIGMLSIGDLVNWTIQRQQEEIQHLNHYIVGAYPA